MTIWTAIRQCIVQKYVSGKGRASRGEFFSYLIAFLLFCFFWLLFILGIIDYDGDLNLLDFVLLYIPFLFLPPLVAVGARRLHDSGKSGWLLLLMLVPLVNILGFGLLCVHGTPFPNHYGAPPPKLEI